jgi:hypothetical protein
LQPQPGFSEHFDAFGRVTGEVVVEVAEDFDLFFS